MPWLITNPLGLDARESEMSGGGIEKVEIGMKKSRRVWITALKARVERPAAARSCLTSATGGAATDLGLDLVRRTDAPLGLGRHQRLVGGVDVEERLPCVTLARHSTRFARGTLGSLAKQKTSCGASSTASDISRTKPP
jgi:hypothetical protein